MESRLSVALRASVSASAIRHGQLESLPAVTRAGISVQRLHNVSSKCRIAHSLSSSRKWPAVAARSAGPQRRGRGTIRMEEATTVTPTTTTTGDAGPLGDEDDSEAPILSGPVDVSQHVAVLKRAAKTKKVPATEVFAALRAIEKAKVDPSNFLQALGGTQSPGRTWMLIFSSSQDLVREALNGGPGGGQYLPVSAIQNFDAETLKIENGVYLGPLGALAFEGRFSWKKRILAFIFDKVKIKVGILPAFTINIGKKADDGRVPGNTDPFFIFFYADDEILVAKGRGGGVAFWCRCKRVNSSDNF